MSQTWKSTILQILLKADFMKGNKTALTADYNVAGLLTDVVMRDAGPVFSFDAVVDKILMAMAMIVTAIGENRASEYRPYFLVDTTPLASGDRIPLEASGKPKYGVVSDFRDAYTDHYLTEQPREIVLGSRRQHPRRIIRPHHYYSDGIRVWHTRVDVTAEVVAWDREAERVLILTANHTENCPLPSDLLPCLEFGSLALIQRGEFNAQQAAASAPLFIQELSRIAGRTMEIPELAAKT
jgi:hypothetical protein